MKLAKKIKQMLSNTMRLDFCYLKITHSLHPRYHSEITGHILKNKQYNNCVCIHEIILLFTVKMKMNMKERSHLYDINSATPRHIINIIKQHLRNI